MPGPGGSGRRRDLGRRQRRGRRRDQQRIGERGEDQRAGRERLDVERVRQGDRRGAEDAVGFISPRAAKEGCMSTFPAPRPTAAAPTAPARRTLRREIPVRSESRLSSTWVITDNLQLHAFPRRPLVVRWPGLSRVRTAAIDEGSEEDALNARGAASPEAGRDLASQVVTPLAAAAQRAVTAHPGRGGRAVTRMLGRAPGSSTHLCACSGKQSMSRQFFCTPPLISAKTHPKIGEQAP